MTIEPQFYFALGTSLANLKNVEIDLIDPPHVIDEYRIPFLGPGKERTGDGLLHRGGWISANLHWDSVDLAALMTYVPTLWSNFQTASVAAYASWIAEDGYYNPFSVILDRPLEGENYKRNMMGNLAVGLKIPGIRWKLQALAKTVNYTVTTSDRLIQVDTSGADKTMTLPLANTPQPYTVFSFVKTAAAHNLIVDGNGSETIDGALTKTLTALNARLDIYSTGTVWKSV